MAPPRPNLAVNSFVVKEDVQKAEIRWALTTTSAHISDRAAEKLANSFPTMFHDSAIANKMAMHKDKHAYLVNYGLSKYIGDQVTDEISKSHYLSFSYDEAMNKFIKKCQMDVHIRYIHDDKVKTKFLTAKFLESSTAEDLFQALIDVMNPFLKEGKVISISMDGPNVNLKVLKLLETYLKSLTVPQMIYFGTCSLHVIHGSVGTGHDAVKWTIKPFLRCSHYLFAGFPSRRGKYKEIIGSSDFPASFSVT